MRIISKSKLPILKLLPFFHSFSAFVRAAVLVAFYDAIKLLFTDDALPNAWCSRFRLRIVLFFVVMSNVKPTHFLPSCGIVQRHSFTYWKACWPRDASLRTI